MEELEAIKAEAKEIKEFLKKIKLKLDAQKALIEKNISMIEILIEE